ncbi:MAG: ABC transporter ATP-binding protein, partial [Clostridia bacterium]
VLLHTRENLTGVRVLRAFDKQNDEIALFERENGLLCDMQRGVGRISALMNPLTYVLVNSALIVLLWNGAWQVQGGLLTQGAMVALVNYLSQILVELIKLANLIVTITKALACATRIETVLQQQPSMLEPEAPTSVGADTPECICFRNVSARYQGAGGDALTDVSFTALRAQTIGVIGGTGSGKSTLCSLIPRFYDATAGEVRVNGVNVKEQPLDALRQKIGVVPQKAVLFQGTIRDNLRWGKQSATDEELWRALHIAQAADVVRGKALGLDEPVEQNGRNLSGGQRQRLTIARALVKQPEVLILDDSASALDYATDAALRKALRELSIPATVFVISQRASSVRFADLILVLDDGRLVGSGTHEALLRDCPIYQEIYYSQYPKEAV